MTKERLFHWMTGKLSDDELSTDEIEWLADAVMEAIAEKLGAQPEPGLLQ